MFLGKAFGGGGGLQKGQPFLGRYGGKRGKVCLGGSLVGPRMDVEPIFTRDTILFTSVYILFTQIYLTFFYILKSFHY